MGRAIDQDNRLDGHDGKLDGHDHRLQLLEDAVEELLRSLASTKKVHHVDLHDDEEFTPPVGKRKKTTKVEKSNTKAEKSSAEA